MRKKLSRVQVSTVRKMFKSGKTRAQVAEEMGCSYAQVNYAIKKAPLRGIAVRDTKRTTVSRAIDWKAKYMKAAIILLDNGLVDIVNV